MADPNTVVPVDDTALGRAVTVLLEMYKENTNHGRHLETQRQLVTGFILTIAAAALAALTTFSFADKACVWLGSLLVIFGMVGTSFCVVQYGKYTQSRARWCAAREILASICPAARLQAIKAASDVETYVSEQTSTQDWKLWRLRAWLKIGKLPLHWLWISLPALVLVLGTSLVVRGVYHLFTK